MANRRIIKLGNLYINFDNVVFIDFDAKPGHAIIYFNNNTKYVEVVGQDAEKLRRYLNANARPRERHG